MPPRYLRLQHRKYWARFQVPADVREAFGKREYWINLNTSDLITATAHCARATSEFRSKVLEARGRAGSIEADALWWRQQIEEAKSEAEHSAMVDEAIKAMAEKLVRGGFAAVHKAADRFHEGEEGAALIDLGGPKARTFVDIAILGRKPTRLFVEAWARSRAGEVEAKTAYMDKVAVQKFAEAFPIVAEINKRGVAQWLQARKGSEGVSAATISREMSGLRSFWAHLKSQEQVTEDAPDPFAGVKFKDRAKAVAQASRQAFTPHEIAKLYTMALKGGDQQLADLIALGAYTGARIEDLCAMELRDVTKAGLVVRDAKTGAGMRTVPIHPKLKPTIARLKGDRKDGWLIDGLGADKYGKRSVAIGKRFGYLKRRAGHGPEKVFHSIRRTVVTQLERAAVSENVTADIVGHKKPRITYGLYSGREATEPLRKAAIAKLTYPAPLG